MLTLMILVAAAWLGLYLAKRITRPVQMLATAADEIGAGHLDHRVDVKVGDEFAGLIERSTGWPVIWPRAAGGWSGSASRARTEAEVEGRRQYVETVLDRIATGVISIDNEGRIRTWNSAATQLLRSTRASTACAPRRCSDRRSSNRWHSSSPSRGRAGATPSRRSSRFRAMGGSCTWW